MEPEWWRLRGEEYEAAGRVDEEMVREANMGVFLVDFTYHEHGEFIITNY